MGKGKWRENLLGLRGIRRRAVVERSPAPVVKLPVLCEWRNTVEPNRLEKFGEGMKDKV